MKKTIYTLIFGCFVVSTLTFFACQKQNETIVPTEQATTTVSTDNLTTNHSTNRAGYTVTTTGGNKIYVDNTGTVKKYVQVIDMRTSTVSFPVFTTSSYSSNNLNPVSSKKTATSYYDDIKLNNSNIFSVTNAALFDQDSKSGLYACDKNVNLCLPVKDNGTIKTIGGSIDATNVKKTPKKMLYTYLFVPPVPAAVYYKVGIVDYTTIQNYSDFTDTKIKNSFLGTHSALVGFSTETSNTINFQQNKAIARTFVGTSTDGNFLYILTTDAMKVADAETEIKSFGATSVMMLDGGGSTQFKCGKELMSSTRCVPSFITVYKK